MSWIQRILYGVDLDEEQFRQQQLDAALAAENEKDRDKYGDAWHAEATANLEKSVIEDVAGDVDRAFDEGLKEGAANVTSYVSKPFEIAGAGVGAVLKGLPWWIYAAGALALAFLAWPVLGPLLGARLRR